MSSDSIASAGAGFGPETSGREEILNHLREDFDDHVARFFDRTFSRDLFQFTYHKDSGRFTIQSRDASDKSLRLQCKVFLLSVRLGLVVPQRVEGEFTSVIREGKEYRRIRFDLSASRVHYDSYINNPLLKLFTKEMHDNLVCIDLLVDAKDPTHHELVLVGESWITTMDSKHLEFVSPKTE